MSNLLCSFPKEDRARRVARLVHSLVFAERNLMVCAKPVCWRVTAVPLSATAVERIRHTLAVQRSVSPPFLKVDFERLGRIFL